MQRAGRHEAAHACSLTLQVQGGLHVHKRQRDKLRDAGSALLQPWRYIKHSTALAYSIRHL